MKQINYDGLFETAAVRHLKDEYDENLDVIKLQRGFVEYHLGDVDLDHYYKVSQLIIKGIDKLPEEDRDAQYSYIYLGTIQVCASAVALGAYEFAKEKYQNAFHVLEWKYAREEFNKEDADVLKHTLKRNKKTNE